MGRSPIARSADNSRYPFETSGSSPLTEGLMSTPQHGTREANSVTPNEVRVSIVDGEALDNSGQSPLPAKIRTGKVVEDDSPQQSSSWNSPTTDEMKPMRQNRRLAVDLAFSDEQSSIWGTAKRVLHNTWKSLQMIRLFLSLAWVDFKARSCSYCLGFFSVFVVVMLCVLMISLLTNMPIIFLRLSEATRGEFDLLIAPGGVMTRAASLNYSIIKETFPPDSEYGLHAPRFIDVFTAQKVSSCIGKTAETIWYSLNGTLCDGAVSCMEECSPTDHAVVNLIAFDTAAEKRMGLGTTFDEPVPGKAEMILSRRASLLMGGAEVGDVVAVYNDAAPSLRRAFEGFTSPNTDVIMLFTVIAIAERDERKFPGITSFAAINFDTFLEDVAAGLDPLTSPADVAAVAGTDPNECATSAYFIMEPFTRLVSYRSTSYNEIRRRVVGWCSGILSPLGVMQLRRSTPQLGGLYSTRMMSVFLGLIISIILLALAFLSIVLIYTLLTVGIETKTYELGIQRMVGFTKENLIVLVLTNAYSFTIPAWILGLAAGQGVYVGIRQMFIKLIAVTLPLGVTGESIGFATLAGLGIPIIASFFPIMALITQKLPDALNTSRGRSVGVVFKIHRNGASELNGTMFGLGILLFVFGFLIYYLFPTALIVMNLSLIFYIFFGVLMGLLAGFVLLALNFERVCQVCISYLLLFWESKAVFSFMQKSLSAHRQRNRKTTLMYALSLAFIVFITVSVQIELTYFQYSSRQQLGGEVVVDAGYVAMRDFWVVDEHLAGCVAAGNLSKYTYDYSTPTFGRFMGMTMTSLGRFRSSDTFVVPIPPNWFDVLDSSFLLINNVDPLVGRYGMGQSLYTLEGMRKGIMSSGTSTFLGLQGTRGTLLFTGSKTVNTTANLYGDYSLTTQTTATLDLSPVVGMTKYSAISTPWVISIPNLMLQLNDPYNSVLAGTVAHIRLRVADEDMYNAHGDELTSLLSSLGYTATVRTITEVTEDMATAGGILDLFFVLAELMILLICFFSLMSSMTTNVLNSSKEIGVLLCMGMTHFQVYRVYIWEAFILVVSSGVMGLIVGVIVAYTMLLQQVLFAEISFPFPFPYMQLCIVVAVGFVSALASSISPVAYLFGLPSVTHILRRSIT